MAISNCPVTIPDRENNQCREPIGPWRQSSRYSSKPISTVGGDKAVAVVLS